MTLIEVTEPIYCTCKERCDNKNKTFLLNKLCVCCNKRIKISINFNPFKEVLDRNSKTPNKLKEAVLLNGVNLVVIKDVEYKIYRKSISILNKQDAYDLDYDSKRTRYSVPMGHIFDNPNKRCFKSGLVKGYFNKDKEFVIVKQVKKDGVK